MKNYYEVIQSPLITEKGTMHMEKSKYQFLVHPDANKIEIKKAVETVYQVKVKKVNVLKVEAKLKRVRVHLGYTSERKKAIVTLEKGQTIEFV